jgi:hypothetical protein
MQTTIVDEPKSLRRFADKTRLEPRLRSDDYLLRSGREYRLYVIDRSHTAADAERHERFFANLADKVERDQSVVSRCIDIEKHQLIGLQLIEDPNGIYRVTDVFVILEADRFYQRLVF